MFIIGLLYFTTRLPFLRNSPIFYDSFEYLRLAERLTLSNFSEILRSTHQPVHTFYFVTILIFKKFFFFLSPQDILLIISLVFGYLSVLVWYLFVEEVLNEKVALYSSLLVLVFPYFFVANTNILYESELIFFQILSLYFFVKKRYIFASAAFAVGQLIFIGNIIVLPVFFLLLFRDRKKKFRSFILFLFCSLIIYLIVDFLFLKTPEMFLGKYGYHIFNFTSTKEGLILTIARAARNIITQTIAILSVSGTIFLLLAIINGLIMKNRKTMFYALWIIPLFFIMQYWPVGLYGRLALFIIFPSSLILVMTFLKRKIVLIIIPFFITLTTFHYALQQKYTPPLYQYYSFVKELKKNNNFVFITSDFNRFLYEKNNIPIFIFNGVDQNIPQAKQFILENLKKGKRVIIDSAGLRFPFYQFDGSFYHILSLGKLGESQAKHVLEKFDFKPLMIDQNNKDLFFLEIAKPSESAKTLRTIIVYPQSLYSINHNQPHLYDPLVNLFYLILKKKDPAYWTYDKM